MGFLTRLKARKKKAAEQKKEEDKSKRRFISVLLLKKQSKKRSKSEEEPKKQGKGRKSKGEEVASRAVSVKKNRKWAAAPETRASSVEKNVKVKSSVRERKIEEKRAKKREAEPVKLVFAKKVVRKKPKPEKGLSQVLEEKVKQKDEGHQVHPVMKKYPVVKKKAVYKKSQKKAIEENKEKVRTREAEEESRKILEKEVGEKEEASVEEKKWLYENIPLFSEVSSFKKTFSSSVLLLRGEEARQRYLQKREKELLRAGFKINLIRASEAEKIKIYDLLEEIKELNGKRVFNYYYPYSYSQLGKVRLVDSVSVLVSLSFKDLRGTQLVDFLSDVKKLLNSNLVRDEDLKSSFRYFLFLYRGNLRKEHLPIILKKAVSLAEKGISPAYFSEALRLFYPIEKEESAINFSEKVAFIAEQLTIYKKQERPFFGVIELLLKNGLNKEESVGYALKFKRAYSKAEEASSSESSFFLRDFEDFLKMKPTNEEIKQVIDIADEEAKRSGLPYAYFLSAVPRFPAEKRKEVFNYVEKNFSLIQNPALFLRAYKEIFSKGIEKDIFGYALKRMVVMKTSVFSDSLREQVFRRMVEQESKKIEDDKEAYLKAIDDVFYFVKEEKLNFSKVQSIYKGIIFNFEKQRALELSSFLMEKFNAMEKNSKKHIKLEEKERIINSFFFSMFLGADEEKAFEIARILSKSEEVSSLVGKIDLKLIKGFEKKVHISHGPTYRLILSGIKSAKSNELKLFAETISLMDEKELDSFLRSLAIYKNYKKLDMDVLLNFFKSLKMNTKKSLPLSSLFSIVVKISEQKEFEKGVNQLKKEIFYLEDNDIMLNQNTIDFISYSKSKKDSPFNLIPYFEKMKQLKEGGADISFIMRKMVQLEVPAEGYSSFLSSCLRLVEEKKAEVIDEEVLRAFATGNEQIIFSKEFLNLKNKKVRDELLTHPVLKSISKLNEENKKELLVYLNKLERDERKAMLFLKYTKSFTFDIFLRRGKTIQNFFELFSKLRTETLDYSSHYSHLLFMLESSDLETFENFLKKIKKLEKASSRDAILFASLLNDSRDYYTFKNLLSQSSNELIKKTAAAKVKIELPYLMEKLEQKATKEEYYNLSKMLYDTLFVFQADFNFSRKYLAEEVVKFYLEHKNETVLRQAAREKVGGFDWNKLLNSKNSFKVKYRGELVEYSVKDEEKIKPIRDKEEEMKKVLIELKSQLEDEKGYWKKFYNALKKEVDIKKDQKLEEAVNSKNTETMARVLLKELQTYPLKNKTKVFLKLLEIASFEKTRGVREAIENATGNEKIEWIKTYWEDSLKEQIQSGEIKLGKKTKNSLLSVLNEKKDLIKSKEIGESAVGELTIELSEGDAMDILKGAVSSDCTTNTATALQHAEDPFFLNFRIKEGSSWVGNIYGVITYEEGTGRKVFLVDAIQFNTLHEVSSLGAKATQKLADKLLDNLVRWGKQNFDVVALGNFGSERGLLKSYLQKKFNSNLKRVKVKKPGKQIYISSLTLDRDKGEGAILWEKKDFTSQLRRFQ